jgi:hypothetical protein
MGTGEREEDGRIMQIQLERRRCAFGRSYGSGKQPRSERRQWAGSGSAGHGDAWQSLQVAAVLGMQEPLQETAGNIPDASAPSRKRQ